MRFRIFCILLIVLISTSKLAAQIQVVGKIVDETTRQPIIGANIRVKNSDAGATTDEAGKFSLNLAKEKRYDLHITHVAYENKSLTYNLKSDADNEIVISMAPGRKIEGVEVKEKYIGDMRRAPKIPPSAIPSATGNFEDIVKTMLGVSSSSELTANYNVRGGNFDENLVYVNDIAIYQPQLARSGRQEGLSFIHSQLVDDIHFSAGGFEARYGDKLSSVLDVEYKEPTDTFAASVIPSFLGVQSHIESRPTKRISFLAGFRFRSNSYVLNSLETEGDYNPVFIDFQTLTTFHATENFEISLLTHYANNKFRVVPQDRRTNFGTINQALSLRVFFDGQRVTQYETFTGALSFDWSSDDDDLQMKFIISSFLSDQSENFDVLGEYFINELETDLGSEDLGDSTGNIGVGAFLDHARNDLNLRTGNASYISHYNYEIEKSNNYGKLFWGARYRYQWVNDVLKEWHMLDSSGYSIPQGSPNKVELQEVIRSENKMISHRISGYLQNRFYFVFPGTKTISYEYEDTSGQTHKKDTVIESNARLSYDLGVRSGYFSFNKEAWLTPRMSLNYQPRTYFYDEERVYRRPVNFRLSTGLYYQPPSYRSARDLYGNLNPNIRVQKSLHVVLGADAYFKIFDRPFQFTAEGYYKYLWDVNPYEVDNVRIRYYANNDAKVYAYGVDMGINGQLIPGIESWLKVGFLKTKENHLNDDFYIYLNSSGDTIVPGFTDNDEAVDSTLQTPGYIPRPTDKVFNISLLFQDNMPGFEALSVQLNTQFGTGLPYGPPDYKRYKDTLRTKSYFRVDIGFTMDFLFWRKNKRKEAIKAPWLRKFKLSFEVFNLLNIKNTINYTWLQDVNGRNYSIPNSLTGRRFNLKLIAGF